MEATALSSNGWRIAAAHMSYLMLKLYEYECAEGHILEVVEDSDDVDWLECDECGHLMFKIDGVPQEHV
jgi:hypothetical protein